MPDLTPRPASPRRTKDSMFYGFCLLAAATAVLILVVLLVSILMRGLPMLGWTFFSSPPSNTPDEAGIFPAMIGTIMALIIVALTAIPIGVATAILLEEYKPKHALLARVHGFVQLNITNLAGVPSIVYGILGVTVFATFFYIGGTTGEPMWQFGEKRYLEYSGLGGTFFYVKSAGIQGTPVASHDFTYYDGLGSDAKEAEITIGSSEEFADASEQVTDQLQSLLWAIEDQTYEQQTGDSRSPIDFTPEEASASVDAVIQEAQADLNTDLKPFKPDMIEAFMAMNGSQPTDREVIDIANALLAKVRTAEFDARGFGGVILADAVPQVRLTKPWYYLQFPFGRSVLAAGLTLMLVILPIVIVSSQEAIRAVPPSMRAGSLALGGTKWQAIQKVVLPAAIPGICTGAILALSRAIGEAAPVLLIAPTIMRGIPSNFMERAGMMPLQIFYWAQQPSAELRQLASTGIIVLLAVLLTFNAVAVFIRQKLQQEL